MSFIAIMGKSGSGKTTLINALIKAYPNFYMRAESYTTRSPRENETGEYEFITSNKMHSMLENKEILYIDEAFGYEYAMNACVFNDTRINRIKEIHPHNITKLRIYEENVITVLIINNHSKENRNRIDDFEYESVVADLTFINDISVPLDLQVEALSRKIQAIIMQKQLELPDAKDIDEINKKGYDNIAAEFTDRKRLTTANFHQASESFFKDKIMLLDKKDNIIEIGSGNGWLSSVANFDIPSIDLSDKMNAGLNQNHISISQYDYVPFSYDRVFASLCDPYFYPIAIARMINMLKPDGRLYLSLPSKEWSTLNRGEKQKTVFIDSNGNESEVYSFTYSLNEINRIGKYLGFYVDEYVQGFINPQHIDFLSPAITAPAKQNNIDINTLCVVECYTLKRRILL